MTQALEGKLEAMQAAMTMLHINYVSDQTQTVDKSGNSM